MLSELIMLSDERRKQRNRDKARRRKLARKSASPVVPMDAFRRLRFEGELRRCVSTFYGAAPTREVMRSLQRAVRSVIAKYARSKKLARSVRTVVEFDEHSETVVIGYWRDGREVNVYDVYDAINPGAKKIIGMHVGKDGSRSPVMQGDPKPETT